MMHVELRDLTFQPPERATPVVDALQLEILPGEITVLAGPPGSGRKTTLRLIAGVIHPTRGDILHDRRSVLALAPEERSTVLMLARPLLFPHLDVLGNVEFGLRMRGVARKERRARAAELLERVGMAQDASRAVGTLTALEARRVALARTYCVRPDVVLLEQPFDALGGPDRAVLRELIRSLQAAEHVTTVLVTDEFQDASMLAAHVAVLIDGQLHQVDAPATLYDRPSSIDVARFLGSANFLSADVTGETAITALGAFRIDRTRVPQGPGILTIRPDAITLGGTGENTLSAQVLSCSFLGTQVRVRLLAQGTELEAVLPGHRAREFLAGTVLDFELPPSAIWILPATGSLGPRIHPPTAGGALR